MNVFQPLMKCVLLLAGTLPFVTAIAQQMGTVPDSAGPNQGYRLVRHDAESLAQLGGGDRVKGMNALGERGYELFIVTTAGDDGAAGWYFFRQLPWNLPIERPKLEYKQFDDAGIAELGASTYATGIQKLENEGWQLVTITTTKNGGVGWSFFMRERPKDAPAGSAVPAPMTPLAPAAATAGDFSTPRAAVQTLIAAAAAKDLNLLSQCFAEDAAEEFKPFRNKTATKTDLDELAELFKNGAIESEEVHGTSATVKVKLENRLEEMQVSKRQDGWKIMDF